MHRIKDLYQEIIMEYNNAPKNFGVMESPDITVKGYNPLCGDKIKIFLKKQHNKKSIHSLKFISQSCVISKASSSILIDEALKKKSKKEIIKFIENIINIFTKNTSSKNIYIGDFYLLLGIINYPSRIKCLTLPFYTLKKAINKI